MQARCDLIRSGAQFQLNEVDRKGLLFFAAVNDEQLVIRRLLSKRVDLNATDDNGKTAVFYANENRSMFALCELIECGVQFNLEEIDAKAVLFFAAVNDMGFVIGKLHLKSLNLNATDDNGKTAVFYANENRSMFALCELIECDAEFTLDGIDARGILFFAANYCWINTMKSLYNAGLDLNLIDKDGKTVVFYCNQSFLDSLIALDHNQININARDTCGRTPLFYAVLDNNAEKARHLIENGGNLKLEDNCNVNIFSFFIQNCILKEIDFSQSFFPDLVTGRHETELILAIFDSVYCQSPLLSLTGSFLFPNLYTIFNYQGILGALKIACSLIDDGDQKNKVERVSSILKEEEIDVPLVMSLLNKLGANPNAADLDGNTAVHYAALLPFLGVPEEAIMRISKTLRKFGAIFSLENQQHESPLQFCLSPKLWKAATKGDKWQSSIKGLVEICKFLISSGCNITVTCQSGESTFHRVILRIQDCLELTEDAPRKTSLPVLMEVLILLSPNEAAVSAAVNNPGPLLNSPLHLWASIALKSPEGYANLVTEEHTFESILRIIFDHLLKCGAKLNVRNVNEETPLHVCRTWAAAKILLDAGANPKDFDVSGNSPLLAAAKKKNSDSKDCFYPDVRNNQENFWNCALEKGLDPLVIDKHGESILNLLLKSESFVISSALVNAACKDSHGTNESKLSFLKAICADESKHKHWKILLVEAILNSAKTNQLFVESPLRLCCWNIKKYGLFDDESSCIQQNKNEKASEEDGQPPRKKQKKGEWGKEEEEEKGKVDNECKRDYNVHGKIANQLLLYGADIHLGEPDGVSCVDIAKDCPTLKDFLEKPIEIDSLPILIPWTSVSEKCNCQLAKVARRQEYRVIGQILYHKTPIGNGSFGLIFAGINSKDGREVAVKRAEKLRMNRSEDKREIFNLTALADCEQVVRYISFSDDGEFSYLVLELMEGNLEQLLQEFTIDATQANLYCKDVVMGLEFLHKQKIFHRDLKPQNILYKILPKRCLKIADFGLSRKVDSSCTTVYGTGVGTRCWIAPEVLTFKVNSVDKDRFGATSDMFSCGMILHYILTGRKHPFSPMDCSSKSEIQICNETEANIMKGDKMERWDVSLSREASHLVKGMLENNEKIRPSAQDVLEHPLFWSGEKKMDFLQTVGNQKEFECPRSERTFPLTMVETDLETRFGSIVKLGNWINKSYKYMPQIHNEMTRRRGRKNYDTKSAVELVRFIRNVYQHYKDNSFVLPVPIEQLLFNDFVFLETFPDLLIEVYQAITTHGWDKSRDDIKSVMNKK